MKKIFEIIVLSLFLFGCNSNPNKEARIRKLETQIQLSLEKINELEEKVTILEKNNAQLELKLKTIDDIAK